MERKSLSVADADDLVRRLALAHVDSETLFGPDAPSFQVVAVEEGKRVKVKCSDCSAFVFVYPHESNLGNLYRHFKTHAEERPKLRSQHSIQSFFSPIARPIPSPRASTSSAVASDSPGMFSRTSAHSSRPSSLSTPLVSTPPATSSSSLSSVVCRQYANQFHVL